MKTTANREIVLQAIANVNKKQGYFLSLNRDETRGKYFFFTLKSPSKVPGSRRSTSGRNLAAASWHAHGYVMDEIFNLCPDCFIESLGQKYYKGFRWVDQNVGSMVNPCQFSELSNL